MPPVSRAFPFAFLLLSLVGCLMLVFSLPPYQGADELAHLYRADLTTFAHLTGQRIERNGNIGAGGPTDLSLQDAERPFADIRFEPQHKADVADFAAAAPYRWDGRGRIVRFDGSAMYPPTFYLPASAAISAGKALGWPVLRTIRLARLANALACTLVGFVALLLARRSRPFMFAVLMLPMTLALSSTVTNDGLLIAVTALGCAIPAPAMYLRRSVSTPALWASAACFAMVGMAKLPYALFGLVLLSVDAERPRARWAAAAAVFGLGIGWYAWMAGLGLQVPLHRPGVVIDPGGQVLFLLSHPLHVFTVAAVTLAENADDYGRTVIGVLGWLDTPLPEFFYVLAWAMLAVAAAVSLSRRGGGWRGLPLAALALGLLVFGAIHAALYVTWNGVGALRVEGVAGRYFLPLLAFLSLVFEGEAPLWPERSAADKAAVSVEVAVMAFPILGLLLAQQAILVRYYLD